MLKFQDLADYPGILKAIQDLSSANDEYGRNVEETNERIRLSQLELIKTIRKYRDELIATNTSQKSGQEFIKGVSDEFLHATTACKNYNTTLSQNRAVVDSNNKVLSAMEGRLKELQKEYEKLDLTQKNDLKRKKEIERELVSTTRALNGLSTATTSSGRAVKAAEGSYNSLKQSTKELKTLLDAMPSAYNENTGEINKNNKAAASLNAQYQKQVELLGKIEKGQGIHNRNVGNYPKSGFSGGAIGGALLDVTGLGALGTAAGVAGVIASAGAAVVKVGMEYEKLNILTEAALKNNKAAAQEASALIKNFADNSPREVDEVTMAFNRMVDIGIVPTKEQLVEISDVAATKNKTMMDYVEAIADAQMGEFERLKEFSIDASKSGDKVIFTFKGVRTEVDNNATAINNYLLGLGKVPGVMGTTDKLAQSFSGRLSTMWDGIKGIANDIFQFFLPALNAVASGLGWIVDKIGTVTTGFRQMAKEQGFLVTIGKAIINPFAATTEAYQAGKKTKDEQANAGTPNLDAYRKEVDQQNKINEAKRKADEAQKKAADEADKRLREALDKSKANTETQLAQIEAKQQDGLITEREYLKKRQAITLAGIAQRQALLLKAGKKETDDYKKLNADKIEAQTQYKRDMLKLRLSESKTDASEAVAGLGRKKEDGEITDMEFIEQRRGIMVASLNEQLQILKDAGQGQSKLASDINKQLLEVDRDYFRDRLKVTKDEWGKQLQATKEGLEKIDRETAEEYEGELIKITQFYNKKRQAVRTDVTGRKITQDEGDRLLGLIDIQELEEQVKAVKRVYDKDQAASNSLVEAKIQALEQYKLVNGRTQKEILSANEQILQLKRARDKEAADDKIALDKKVADNAIEQSNKTDRNDEENSKRQRDRRQEILDKAIEVGKTLVDGIFSIQQQETQNRIAELDKQQAYELQTAGDSEAAKAFISQKYEARRKDLMRQQAMRDRDKALFDIAVNTAVAISKSLPNLALAALAGALGVVQAGIVLATPLPTYFTGKNFDGVTNDTYSGPAIAGERGREIWVHDGKTELLDKPSLINVGRNDVIYPNNVTEKMLESGAIAARTNQQSATNRQLGRNREDYQVRQMVRATDWSSFPVKRLANAIGEANEKLPFNYSITDADGTNEYTQKVNQRIKHLNRTKFPRR